MRFALLLIVAVIVGALIARPPELSFRLGPPDKPSEPPPASFNERFAASPNVFVLPWPTMVTPELPRPKMYKTKPPLKLHPNS